jgi:hypothetical protein
MAGASCIGFARRQGGTSALALATTIPRHGEERSDEAISMPASPQ